MKKFFKSIISRFFYSILNSNEFSALEKKSFKFKNLGTNSFVPEDAIIKNAEYISIGNNFQSLYNLRIEAWDGYLNERFQPEISIGNDVSANTDVHIGCINKVIIGNNVLIASRVYISDHSHGEISKQELSIPPAKRNLVSKGIVVVEDNVWIGEGVCILPGVTIGKNSVIGANAVVTKSIPSNCIAAGIPARIINQL